MSSLHAVAVLREPVFSPGMVAKDAAILHAAAAYLAQSAGVDCPVIPVTELDDLSTRPDLVLSMANGGEALERLATFEARGTVVINSTEGVFATRRDSLLELSPPNGPLVEGALVATNGSERLPRFLRDTSSVWVKRGNYHALGPTDVVRVATRDVETTLRSMHARGITSAVIQPHLDGDIVKFYGVLGDTPSATFFRWYPIDGPGPDPTTADHLRSHAFMAASSAGVSVFGGDAVPVPGSPAPVPILVDLNAWPSFWRCRGEAAVAIAELALGEIGLRLRH